MNCQAACATTCSFAFELAQAAGVNSFDLGDGYRHREHKISQAASS